MSALAPDEATSPWPQQEVEHVRHLVRARPAVGCAAHLGGVGDLAREQRTFGAETREDVARGSPRSPRATAGCSRAAASAACGQHQRQQAHRPERAVELEEQAVDLDRLCSWPGSYDQPIRDHSTVCSQGAIVAVGSILM